MDRKAKKAKRQDFRAHVFTATGQETDIERLTPIDVYDNVISEELLAEQGISPEKAKREQSHNRARVRAEDESRRAFYTKLAWAATTLGLLIFTFVAILCFGVPIQHVKITIIGGVGLIATCSFGAVLLLGINYFRAMYFKSADKWVDRETYGGRFTVLMSERRFKQAEMSWAAGPAILLILGSAAAIGLFPIFGFFGGIVFGLIAMKAGAKLGEGRSAAMLVAIVLSVLALVGTTGCLLAKYEYLAKAWRW